MCIGGWPIGLSDNSYLTLLLFIFGLFCSLSCVGDSYEEWGDFPLPVLACHINMGNSWPISARSGQFKDPKMGHCT